ncbi:hypothetical protein E6O75_ATG03050 [Venturia nashicola]|uniref:Uncharacterized protein n=1 Tax=Venturia nashicola TaxID=86259 RepID=A0A4Z1PMF7_9PEZI|nr:hypothetical protein E6O75_ATG03050 [Venturia nashicola]
MHKLQLCEQEHRGWNLIDLGCATTGEATGGNSTWVKHAKEECFFPGAIVQPQGWLGNHAGGFYCAPGTGVRPKSDHSLLRKWRWMKVKYMLL